jgi:hypothetical protein
MHSLTAPLAQSEAVPAATLRARAKNWGKIPFALKLVAVTLFLPEESSFYIAGLRLTLTRVIFLVLTPIVVTQLIRKIEAGRYRFVLSDLFVTLTAIWMIVGPANVVGLQDALTHGGPNSLEFLIGYMATRIILSEHGQALNFINLVCCVISIVALLGIADPLTGHFFIRDLVTKITGYTKGFNQSNYDVITRMGILRATSTVEHPIGLGIVSIIGLLCSVGCRIRARWFTIPCCSLGAIIALSSAPIQAALMGFALLTYNRVIGPLPYRWFALMCFGAIGFIALFTTHNSPFGFIIGHFTLDPSSGYFRLWTWNIAGEALQQSPWLGLGFEWSEDFGIPSTVDAVWLVLALTFGIPGSLLVALSYIGAVSLPTSGRRVALTAAESKLGMILGILIFLILYLGFTVDFWGIDWILISLLIGVRGHLGELGRIG